MSTKRAKLEQREKRIIAAARTVFLKHGFNKAKMSQIADAAALAEGTLYLYYKNKNAIVKAVVVDHWRQITDEAQDALSKTKDSFAQLQALADYHLTMMVKHWRVIELGYVLYYSRSDDAGENAGVDFKRTYAALFDRIIERGQDKGHFTNELSLPFLRDLFYGTLEYAARTLVLHNKPEDIDTNVAQLMAVLRPHLSENVPTDTGDDKAVLKRLERAVRKLERLH
ncbi:MAG: TetR/AcrR family transcriptional regulator [Robiginitomaculum sp.]|nr:TetR/AcrR family transcriptional regulator [Robiginitomaculum sp.]